MSATPESTHPPAGWYADPSGQSRWRYWDGGRWTSHVHGSPAGRPGLPPPPGSPSATPSPTGAQPLPDGVLGDILGNIMRMAEDQARAGAAEAEPLRGRFLARPDDPPPSETDHVSAVWVGLAVVVAAAAVVFAVAALFPTEAENTPDQNLSGIIQPAFAALAIALVPLSLYLWERYWLIVDTPTTEVAGAYPGLCEMTGRAQAVQAPVHSWFTNTPCVWYRAEIERRQRSGKSTKWVGVWNRQEGERSFFLTDPSGHVRVDKTGIYPGKRTLLSKTLDSGTRIVETGLAVGDWLYVLGPVRLDEQGLLAVTKKRSKVRKILRPPFWVAQSHESKLIGRLRWAAAATTALAIAAAMIFTMLDVVPGDDPEFATETVLREGSILPGALAVGGLFLALFVLAYVWRLWNRLVALREQARFGWSLIGTAVTQRHDVVGRLVTIVGASAHHEQLSQQAAAAARAVLPEAEEAAAVQATVAVDTRERAQVVARTEAYPDLKVAENFALLFDTLVALENRIAAHRRFYNDAVTVLRDQTGTFPGIILRRPVLRGSEPALLEFDLPHEPVAVELA